MIVLDEEFTQLLDILSNLKGLSTSGEFPIYLYSMEPCKELIGGGGGGWWGWGGAEYKMWKDTNFMLSL